jgi:hypothetical protein
MTSSGILVKKSLEIRSSADGLLSSQVAENGDLGVGIGRLVMINGYVTVLGGVLLAVSTVQSSAGPCSQQIHDVRVAAASRLDAIAGAGKAGAETPYATMHRQPTPNSVAGAEAKLGELSAPDTDAFAQAMERADQADENGDLSSCEQALSDAEHILNREQ